MYSRTLALNRTNSVSGSDANFSKLSCDRHDSIYLICRYISKKYDSEKTKMEIFAIVAKVLIEILWNDLFVYLLKKCIYSLVFLPFLELNSLSGLLYRLLVSRYMQVPLTCFISLNHIHTFVYSNNSICF